MLVGKFFPRTRKYLGFIGILGSSVGLIVLLVVVYRLFLFRVKQSPDLSSFSSRPTPANYVISDDVKTLIIAAIKENPLVLDVAVEQYDKDINLVLVVSSITSEAGAKELGDNFVRITKTLSPDTPPTRSVGTGIYSYLVGVYYPDETEVVLGAKVQSSDRISWK